MALEGTADWHWWRNHLEGDQLEPVGVDGLAQVIVTGLDARWIGIPFRDLSVAIAARRLSRPEEQGYYFARAFNASRFFAGVERWWFHTPYLYRRDLHMEVGDAPAISLGSRPTLDVLAKPGPGRPSGGPDPTQEMGYNGPLFLPRGDDRARRRWLMVRTHGLTSTFHFDAACDRFELGTECPDNILAGLRASHFQGVRWHLRRNATHARSKTFKARR